MRVHICAQIPDKYPATLDDAHDRHRLTRICFTSQDLMSHADWETDTTRAEDANGKSEKGLDMGGHPSPTQFQSAEEGTEPPSTATRVTRREDVSPKLTRATGPGSLIGAHPWGDKGRR